MYDQPQPNYTTQPNYPAPAHVVENHKQVDWRVIGAYIIAAFALGAALVSLWLLSSYKTSAASQVTQLRHQLATAQSAQTKNAKSINGLSGRVSADESQLVLLTPYTMVCSTYLTGPSGGPATFWFPCSAQKPGSGS
jgi:uncharacterized protein HemX